MKQLRDMTGSPLKDCMKTLEETQGDIEKAKDLLRQRGLADAEKRSTRATSEGYVGLLLNRQARLVTIIELHCETDFVAKTDKFKQGISSIIETLQHEGKEKGLFIDKETGSNQEKITDTVQCLNLVRPLDTDLKQQTICDGIKYIVSKTQENC